MKCRMTSLCKSTHADEPAHTDPKTGRKRKACTFIDATIFVERGGQKAL